MLWHDRSQSTNRSGGFDTVENSTLPLDHFVFNVSTHFYLFLQIITGLCNVFVYSIWHTLATTSLEVDRYFPTKRKDLGFLYRCLVKTSETHLRYQGVCTTQSAKVVTFLSISLCYNTLKEIIYVCTHSNSHTRELLLMIFFQVLTYKFKSIWCAFSRYVVDGPLESSIHWWLSGKWLSLGALSSNNFTFILSKSIYKLWVMQNYFLVFSYIFCLYFCFHFS